MKNLFVGHSYHNTTKSTTWFIEFLRNHSSTLEIVWDETWTGGPGLRIDDAIKNNYDHIFIFQMNEAAFSLAKEVPERLVFIPMYDGSHHVSDTKWKSMQYSRILSFSHTLHIRLRCLGLQSLYAQYYPNPNQHEIVKDFSNLRGFYWARHSNLPWPIINRLTESSRWSRFYFHFAPDPPALNSNAISLPSEEDIKELNISITRWFEEKADFDRIASQANIFFASRRFEGIGLSFLEAMARGQCVVAPNLPTHSEYIDNEVSGLLYDPNEPHPIDFSHAAIFGAAARRRVETGHERWLKDLKIRLPKFLFQKTTITKTSLWRKALKDWNSRIEPQFAKPRQYTPRKLRVPLSYLKEEAPRQPLSIAIVTPSYNQGRFLRETISSVLDQNYPNLKYFVQDGASSDETLDVLKSYDEHLRWQSNPDKGQANAINLGFSQVDGEVMGYLNSDDRFLPGTLAYVANAFCKYPDIDLVYGHRINIDEDGLEIGRYIVPPHDAELTYWVDVIPQETLFWRRRVWDAIGPFDEHYRFALDWEFILRAQKARFKFRRLPRFLGCFRVHDDQKSSLLVSVHDEEVNRLRTLYLGRVPEAAEIDKALSRFFRRHETLLRFYQLGILRY